MAELDTGVVLRVVGYHSGVRWAHITHLEFPALVLPLKVLFVAIIINPF